MDNNKKILLLKKKLAAEIAKSTSDSNIILDLSNQIAGLDEDVVRFSVDAGVIDRLGKELVSKAETAVSELVKNGYDADAKNVTLIFENSENAGGKLVIEDDGVGMTRDQLINGFMRLSSTEKIHHPTSDRYKRTRSGRKGVGRFATQRLGEKLTIITQTLKSNVALKVEIDWKKFKRDSSLYSIPLNIQEIKKPRPEGTTLTIEHLRDGWTENSLKKAYRYVAELIQPQPLSKEKQSEWTKRDKIDPGFKSTIFRKVNSELITIADEELMFNNYALASIDGYIDSKGIGRCKIRSTNLKVNESFIIKKITESVDAKGKKKKSEGPYKNLKSVYFKCHYFHQSYLPKQESVSIRSILQTKGGIRLYRNGFRVPSIGEPMDDWLGLDQSVRRRSILDPHGNNSFIGFVEVTDIQGKIFDETSNRESLLENAEFEDLKDFVYRALIKSILIIGEKRGTKGKTNKKNHKRPTEKLQDTVASIDKLAEDYAKKGNKSIASSLKMVSSQIKGAVQEQKEIDIEYLNEFSMLRVLSSLGLTIGEFTHEIKNYLRALKDDTDYFTDKYPKGTDGTTGKRLAENVSSFTSYAAYFDETISQNETRALEPLSLEIEIEKFINIIGPALKRSDITLVDPDFEENGLYTCPMHSSEFRSILFNFFTNARKAILKSDAEGKITLRVGADDSTIFLDFMDNGIGIREDIKDRIFDAFFTTSIPVGHNRSEVEDLTGSGLGLKIVRDIAVSYGGRVFVSKPIKGYKTCFRLEIPAATSKQLEEYGIDY